MILGHDILAPTLLVVDDDDIFREVLQRAFARRGFVVDAAGDVMSALAVVECEAPEFAVVDLNMPGPSGFWLVRKLKELNAQTRVVVVTGVDSPSVAVEAIRQGATEYLTKPASVDDILRAFGFPPGEPVLPAIERAITADTALWQQVSVTVGGHGGDIVASARELGLHPRALRRMLDRVAPAS